MKKLIFIAALLVSSLTVKMADAQVSFNLGINIGSQPDWGPVGYDRVNYYYMPDINSYYDVPNHQFIYLSGNTWRRSASLPAQYRNYDIYNSYKVVVNDRDPWRRNNVYRNRYADYRGRRDQVIIRDSRDPKYKNHWNGHDNGRHNGWDNGRGHGRGHGRP
ncbi:hypothetical protein [Mucilaginibacter sp. KACC 22063]|uniref:hypothetical protein n=1 Tax=Mucilaginibacter sp. KACC 22063 TaxID=3025666 RepID=UPI002365AFFF|nr:hypothetical protein [Mucilaginibacter sp. KACC 22063]WDF55329.1 hypothetical protein PQ461_20570 [Mucilaginibacter sp. KACC 22063]